MGKALYREYRPKTLEDVIGQEHITNTLRNAIDKGAVSHAYLFTGPRGVGKTSVARILAHEINNITYADESTDLDIIEIDAASNRRIDEIRELRDKVHIAPTSSKYKVYIIDEVHMLTREAFNALLKTLEEPPAHVVFILATTESHKVPETIISRTQRFSFRPIIGSSVVNQLRIIADKEKINITDDALQLIAEHGNGSFRDSISTLDQIAGFSNSEISSDNVSMLLGVPDDKIIDTLISSVVRNDADSLFEAMQKLRENGANSSKTAQVIIQRLKASIVDSAQKVDKNLAIKIMKSVLIQTGAQSSFEAIEIAFLEAMSFEPHSKDQSNVSPTTKDIPSEKQNANKEVTKNKKNKINDDITDKVPEIKIEIPEEKLYEVVEQSQPRQSNSWDEVLKSIKKTHGTLYGVLRMAETKVEKDTITLTFRFEFHKKQLLHAKNFATLRSVVDQQLGTGYVIESEVVKHTVTPKENSENSKEIDVLSSVSNIFGGAELLES